jgi:hypothetical protein
MGEDQQRTDRSISMPPRGKFPGLKRGRHNRPYWMARQIARDIQNFPDPCIPLPADADDEELSRLCHDYTAKLLAWFARDEDERAPLPTFDGTVASMIRLFQFHPDSPIQGVKRNTAKTYADSLKVIERTVGARLIRRVTVLDVKRWYREWRAPKIEGGRERIDRAHDAVAMLRMLLRFGGALKFSECRELDAELALVRFEKGGAREQEMTYAQATAFVRQARELGASGKIPEWRGRSMAIGVAAQFELALRQKDVIGEWADDEWSGPFTWENVPGWKLRLKTSKTRAAAVFDLANYPLLYPLLEAVPHAERTGAIVKGEHNLPVRERSYRKWFRAIARAAEIPDEVWSMDSRAGAATEADEAGADLATISDMLTHAEPRTTMRYIRRREKRIANAAEVRVAKRAAEQEGQK